MMDTICHSFTGSEIASAVAATEYLRLLNLPRNYELEGDLLQRAESAREWYGRHGNPFVATKRVHLTEVHSPNVDLEGGYQLQSKVLADRLQRGEAHALMILAASAGHEVGKEISRHWAEGRPDEGFFLDRFAVGVTEYLIFHTAGEICRASEPAQETLMQHLSPGCGPWDLSDQHKLMALLSGGAELGPLRLLQSGAIEPQHSILAVMGITHQNHSLTPERLCRCCDLKPCAFRRAPYSGETLQSMEI